MKTLHLFSVITFAFGMILQSIIGGHTVLELEKANTVKDEKIIYLTDSLSNQYVRMKYIDLDKRLYTPYDGHTVLKHYEDTVTNLKEKFLIKHDIEISKITDKINKK